MKKLLVLMIALNLAACSMSGNNKEATAHKSDDLEFAVDTFADGSNGEEFYVAEEPMSGAEPNFSDFQSDFAAANMPDDNDPVAFQVAEAPVRKVIEHMGEKTPIVDPFTDTFTEQPVIAHQEAYEPETAMEEFPVISQVEAGAKDQYIVQKGDTLMMIAFKIYGDYGMWREIKALNPHAKKIHEGMSLSYSVPERAFGWTSEGNPYLIKTGETLGKISTNVYQTSRRWKELYEHNKPLIKDPNLIFAGFTIYYIPDRQLASEKE